MNWIISDTHFFHRRAAELRGFSSVEEMNDYITKRWNEVVGEFDIVYHLGDFSLEASEGEVEELIGALKGKIILIRGNHDRWSKRKFIQKGFVDVYKRSLRIGGYLLTHKPYIETDGKKLPNGVVNLHGHTHGYETGLDESRYVDYSCEAINYTPQRFNFTR